MISFALPLPPSVNSYWRTWRGRMLISEKGRAYRATVQAECLGYEGFAADKRLAVSVIFNPPDRRRRDIDNICKALLDSLTHAGVYADDSQIDRLTIERGPIVEDGRVWVKIEAT